MDDAFMSMIEYARHCGVSKSCCTGWKRRGFLAFAPDGKRVDVAVSNARLAARPPISRGGVTKVRPGKPAGPIVEEPAAAADPANWTRGEALRQLEISRARLAQIEADRAAGKVASIEEVAEKVSKRFSIVRSRMLAISSKLAPRLAVLNTVEAVGALLDAEVRAALTELSTIP